MKVFRRILLLLSVCFTCAVLFGMRAAAYPYVRVMMADGENYKVVALREEVLDEVEGGDQAEDKVGANLGSTSGGADAGISTGLRSNGASTGNPVQF